MKFLDIIKLKFLPEFGLYSAIPSNIIDKIELSQSKTWLGSFIAGVQKRLVYLMFPLLSLIDIFGGSIKFLGYSFKSLITNDSDSLTDLRFKKNQIFELIEKNIFGLIFYPVGLLVYPQAVTDYFVHKYPEKNHIHSGGNLYQDDIIERFPENIEEIAEIIKKANQEKTKVMPVGAKFSQGKQFIPGHKGKPQNKNSYIVNLKNFKNINIDIDSRTAKVGAGVLWSELQTIANNCGLGVMVAQASNVFSIGGSVGTNIHGWDHVHGSLGNTIKSMKMVQPDGEILTIRPEDELFKLVIGGFGLFGIVTEVELKLTTNVDLIEYAEEISIQDYHKYFDDSVLSSQNTRMHYYRLSLNNNHMLQSGVAVNYIEPTKNTEAGFTNNYQHELSRGTRLERILYNIGRKFTMFRNLYWHYEKSRLLANSRELITHNSVMHPKINAMFKDSLSSSAWLQEYFVPKEKLSQFLKELGPLLTENAVVVVNASVRHIGKDESCISGYATEGDRFAVVICFNQSLREDEVIRTRRWVNKSYDLVTRNDIGGAFYLPYQQFATETQFDKAYPKADIIARKKQEYDPNNVFSSGLYEQYIAPLGKSKIREISVFKKIIQNKSQKERFKGFLNNVLQRVDAEVLYSLLEDIISYTDSHEDIYKKLLERKGEVLPSMVGSIPSILNSLSTIKFDLTKQAECLMKDYGKSKEIKGLIEIGYPGRFVNSFKEKFKITGNIIAVHEEESLTDFVQYGMKKGHNAFVPLDYNYPDLSSIQNNSADMITCFVGLHHFPEDKLGDFLEDIKRILRADGSFLLVDHDCQTEEDLEIATGAHSFFNVLNGVSWCDEVNEVRNFRKIEYWKDKLKEHDLDIEIGDGPDVAMIREGDPSRNRMIRFVNKKGLVDHNNIENYYDTSFQFHRRQNSQVDEETPEVKQVVAPRNC